MTIHKETPMASISVPAPARYGSFIIGMHWLVLILLAGVFAAVEFHDAFPRGSDMRTLLMRMHFSLGMLIFFLTFVRLALRAFGRPAPVIEPEMPFWQEYLAKALHLALYALMIGMPLLGWLMMSANGRAVPFFGLELFPLIGTDKEFAHALGEIHELGGNLFYILVGLHAAAALFHHYIQRDNTLSRMLPIAAAR
jgi:cytochrome b561